jgi:predicted acylesterase/phospholipase RssA
MTTSSKVTAKKLKPHKRAVNRRARVGLALAGGGPLGAIYEIGALAALAESLEGVSLNELDVYVGVSAGSFLAAGLANDITPRDMVRSFIESDEHGRKARAPVDTFDPSILLKPAFGEYAARLAMLPGLIGSATLNYLSKPGSLMASFERLGRAIPTGIFSGSGIDTYLSELFSHSGRTNQFGHLRKKLVVVATDLDSGESVGFGTPGFDEVPISRAVQASAALPGLFPPVEINGRHFVDGALKKTLHASMALKEKLDLLICLNPLVPFNAQASASTLRKFGESPLMAGGLPSVLSQTFRSLIHSRMETGMQKYAVLYPDTCILLLEPDHNDPKIFFTNIFNYSQRRRLCEYAYQRTRRELFERRHVIGAQLQVHGLALNLEVLRDPTRTLVAGAATPWSRLSRAGQATAQLKDTLDDLERGLKRS